MSSGDTLSAWIPKPTQNAKALRLFLEGMNDMYRSLDSLRQGRFGGVRTAGRRASVDLRKLILDGTPLIHRVIHRPRFHQLLREENLEGEIYESEMPLKLAPATREGQLLGVPASHTWRISVHPLHGLKFEREEKKWVFGSLFDLDRRPVPLATWLRQRLFRVDRREYTLGDTLKFIVNKEAVHADIERDIASRDMERVHFDHTTYPHIIAILVASYLLAQHQTSLQANAEQWNHFVSIGDLLDTDYELIGGGEFKGADINPMGFSGEFHETGIQLPEPGKTWKTVQIEDEWTVRP